MKEDLLKRMARAVVLMAMACTSLVLGACSDDDDEGDDSSSSSDAFSSGGQFATHNGTVYLTSAYRLEFAYSGGKLTQVTMSDYNFVFMWDDEYVVTVAHDPLTFTSSDIRLTDVEQNSAGFITSLTKTVDDETVYVTCTYDSSGHLTTLKGTGGSEDFDFVLTWSDSKITKAVNTFDGGDALTYTSFEYDEANVTLQYGPYVESLVEGDMSGLEMLFYLGYLGKAPSYHPSSIYVTEIWSGGSDGDEEDYTVILNSDGSLKTVRSDSRNKTYTFTYQ